MRGWVSLCLLTGAACSPVRDAVTLPPASAYVLGLVRDDALEVYALDGDAAGLDALPTFSEYTGDPTIDLVLYAYDMPLSALSIPAGPLVASPLGGTLPAPARRGVRRIDASGSGDWVISAGETHARLETFRSDALPGTGCVSVESRVLLLDASTNPAVAVIPDGDDAIVITSTPEVNHARDSALWHIETTGTATATRIDGVPGLDDAIAAGQIVTAERGADGRIWLSVGVGVGVVAIFVGTREGGFTRVGSRGEPPVEWVWWMLVEPRPEGDVLWTLTDYGSVNRYDEATDTWTRLSGNAPPSQHTCASLTTHCGGLARALDGTILASDQRNAEAVYRVQGATLVPEPLPPSNNPMTRLVSSPLGPVLVRSSALSTSFTVRDAAGRWATLPAADGADDLVTQRTYSIVGWRDGFVASGVFGFVLQRTQARYCDAIDGVSPGRSTAHIVGLPSALVLTSGYSSTFPTIPPSVAVARATTH